MSLQGRWEWPVNLCLIQTLANESTNVVFRRPWSNRIESFELGVFKTMSVKVGSTPLASSIMSLSKSSGYLPIQDSKVPMSNTNSSDTESPSINTRWSFRHVWALIWSYSLWRLSVIKAGFTCSKMNCVVLMSTPWHATLGWQRFYRSIVILLGTECWIWSGFLFRFFVFVRNKNMHLKMSVFCYTIKKHPCHHTSEHNNHTHRQVIN